MCAGRQAVEFYMQQNAGRRFPQRCGTNLLTLRIAETGLCHQHGGGARACDEQRDPAKTASDGVSALASECLFKERHG